MLCWLPPLLVVLLLAVLSLLLLPLVLLPVPPVSLPWARAAGGAGARRWEWTAGVAAGHHMVAAADVDE